MAPTVGVVMNVKEEMLAAVCVSVKDVMAVQSRASVRTRQSADAPATVVSAQNVVSIASPSPTVSA